MYSNDQTGIDFVIEEERCDGLEEPQIVELREEVQDVADEHNNDIYMVILGIRDFLSKINPETKDALKIKMQEKREKERQERLLAEEK